MQRQKYQKQTSQTTRIVYENATYNLSERSHNYVCDGGLVVPK